MEIKSKLKKVRTQIKYGRVVEAEQGLLSLLDEVKDTEQEKIVLKVLALEFLKSVGGHKRAIPVLRRLLSLDINENDMVEARQFLALSLEQEALIESEPNTSNPEFVELMRVIRNKEIFARSKNPSISNDSLVVTDLDAAKELAWRQEVKPPFQSWNLLRTKASKQIHDFYFANKINMIEIEDAVSAEIEEICQNNLSPVMMHFFDDICADLTLIAMGNLVDVVPDLHAKMWTSYESNCFPCGWQGDYPSGQLCVFPNS